MKTSDKLWIDFGVLTSIAALNGSAGNNLTAAVIAGFGTALGITSIVMHLRGK